MRSLSPGSSQLNRQRNSIFIIFTVIYFAASMGLFAVLLRPQTLPSDVQSIPFLAAWACMYVATIVFLLLYRYKSKRNDIILYNFLILIIASAAWSAEPAKSLVYGIAFLCNILFVLLLRQVLPLPTTLRLVLWTIVGMCGISLALHLAGAPIVLYADAHQRPTLLGTIPIRGLFNHKITAAIYAGVALVLTMALTKGLIRFGVAFGLLFFVLLTGSSAGLALSFIGICILIYVKLAHRIRLAAQVLLPLTIVIICTASAIALGLLPVIAEILGRDPSLTGRTDLWLWGLDAGNERPLLGWGYLGYFGTEHAVRAASQIPRFQNYNVPHFHNSFIQIYVELGLAGLLLGVGLALSAIAGTHRMALRTGYIKESNAGTALGTMIFIAGFIMNAFFSYNDFLSLLLVYLFLASRHPYNLGRSLRRSPQRRSFRWLQRVT